MDKKVTRVFAMNDIHKWETFVLVKDPALRSTPRPRTRGRSARGPSRRRGRLGRGRRPRTGLAVPAPVARHRPRRGRANSRCRPRNSHGHQGASPRGLTYPRPSRHSGSLLFAYSDHSTGTPPCTHWHTQGSRVTVREA